MQILPKPSNSEVAQLCETYRRYPQMGLVVGAGVTAASNVPMYTQLAWDVIREAGAAGYIDATAADELLSILGSSRAPQVDPSELLQIVRDHVSDSKWLAATIKKLLYVAVSIACRR